MSEYDVVLLRCPAASDPLELCICGLHGGSPQGPKGLTEGVKFDTGKPRTDLLPADALLSVSGVLDYGAKKYAARNWEKGMSWGRLAGAAMRHLFQWMNGEEMDKESGHPHLSHFACCALMLLSLYLRNVGTDDRK